MCAFVRKLQEIGDRIFALAPITPFDSRMSNNLRSRQYKGVQRKKKKSKSKIFTLINIAPQYLFSLKKNIFLFSPKCQKIKYVSLLLY